MAFKQVPVLGAYLASLMGSLVLLLTPSSALAQVQTEMRLFSDSFISPTFESAEKTNYQFVGAQIKTDAFSEDSLKMDVAGGVAIGAPLLNYLNISEFYVQSRQSETETFYLGRKKMLWNELDTRWDLGVWEPLFKWNPLNAENQGLTGLFWQVDKPYYTLVLFASPLYIPDQGPSFEIEDGTFVKGNPWFRRPPESIRIWQEATAIDYKFEKPSESQVVLQNSFGLKLSFGDPQGLRGQMAYTYKPANQLAIGYEGNLNVAELKGAVNLQPQVFYHSLVGGDISYKYNRFRFGVSGLYDKPSKDDIFEEKWTHPVFEDAVLVSPFIEWATGAFGVAVQHLDIFGGQVKEEGELASDNRAALMTRYPYQEATQVSVMGNFSFRKTKRLMTKLSFTHSEKNKFDLIRVSARFRLSGLWSFIGEAQLVKADPADKNNQNEVAQFVNNDRLMLGAAYVF
ncbi:hypothetical protein EZJ49_09055 [Bdellovibrio bacteriovorus]|uniref:hypothetical protein n=1 Tax=Bdellovibrio bacteriovorus TaxID=959 RepID=UPI0021D382F7|nr:hypothetical protein [Bdellovibrio bacteriovorus]UXR63225.1 hypothetical protein EZJ49_09055 [Bdellovibrio bacteriovorus]